jgi:hypothetical protein
MAHTIQQIIDNQSKHKSDIISSLKGDFIELKKELSSINTKDKYIKGEKDKLSKRIKNTKFVKSIDSLFFLSKKRSEEFYAWWDEENTETIIYNYDKK